MHADQVFRTASPALFLLGAVAFAPACVPADAPEPAAERFELTIQERRVTGDREVIRVSEGDDVELVWTSDEAVELHLHGYDVELELAPGEPGTMAFNAHATGRFPVTSHGFGGEHGHGHHTLLYLEVYPD